MDSVFRRSDHCWDEAVRHIQMASTNGVIDAMYRASRSILLGGWKKLKFDDYLMMFIVVRPTPTHHLQHVQSRYFQSPRVKRERSHD